MPREDPVEKGKVKTMAIMRGSFFFDPDDAIYPDHFPGNPVVPGSMIIQGFMLAADRIRACHGAFSISGFRFRKFISPGEYDYRIEISGNDMKCTLFEGSSVVASGTLRL